jgi:hypothetical protein
MAPLELCVVWSFVGFGDVVVLVTEVEELLEKSQAGADMGYVFLLVVSTKNVVSIFPLAKRLSSAGERSVLWEPDSGCSHW